jgi:spore coat polysaccharide biosynthesis protein SpsF (cytidylyltransferase family)
MKTIALLSMLHEPAGAHSASRVFRRDPVIGWTVARLLRAKKLAGIVVAAWKDQSEALEQMGLEAEMKIVGERQPVATLDAITAAQKWAYGWRGGLLSTCAYDRGYLGSAALEVAADADAIVLVDPSSALVDPDIIDRLIDSATAGARDYYFTQAPPGLAGVLLKRSMVQKLVDGNAHPGRVVHYLPDAPVLDPVTSDACVELPLSISRSTERLTFDSSRQIERLADATEPLNGTLISTAAEGIIQRMSSADRSGAFPREITLELTTRRACKPAFAPSITRADLTIEAFDAIVAEVSRHDDTRLALCGTGDPLLHPQLLDMLRRCKDLHAVSVETDLVDATDELLQAIVESNVDVVSVHIPAMTPATYATVMGVDRLPQVVENVKKLITLRQLRGRGTPIIVPTFMKLAANIDEMEQWYDTWLRAVGSAVIAGPSDYCGQIADLSVADMTPPLRRRCNRIDSRLTILSDGAIVMCEQDFSGRFPLGRIGETSISDVWRGAMGQVREAHRGGVSLPVLCGDCREWHRP